MKPMGYGMNNSMEYYGHITPPHIQPLKRPHLWWCTVLIPCFLSKSTHLYGDILNLIKNRTRQDLGVKPTWMKKPEMSPTLGNSSQNKDRSEGITQEWFQEKCRKTTSYSDKLLCQPNRGNYTYTRNFPMKPTNSKI